MLTTSKEDRDTPVFLCTAIVYNVATIYISVCLTILYVVHRLDAQIILTKNDQKSAWSTRSASTEKATVLVGCKMVEFLGHEN